MENPDQPVIVQGISRRDFARTVAATAIALPISAAHVTAQTEKTPAPLKPPLDEEGLSREARTEVENNYRALMDRYGERFDAAQQNDLRRLLIQQQKSVEAIRAFELKNGDPPATVLQIGVTEVEIDAER